MKRRHFIQTSGLSLAAILFSDAVFGSPGSPNGKLINFPDEVSAIVNGQMVKLTGKGKQIWTYREMIAGLKNTSNSIAVTIQAPGVKLSTVTLQWKTPVKTSSDILNDQWARTKKMGVNTIAFRGIHQGTFYGADGDCVGLTPKVPWEKNKQWMELVAKSGTPLFISAQPEAMGTEQRISIKECFKLAAQHLPVGEPLDWMENAVPKKWKLNGKIEMFDWD